MNPLPDKGGEMYLVPMNMIDAKNAGKMPEENKPEKKPEGNNGEAV